MTRFSLTIGFARYFVAFMTASLLVLSLPLSMLAADDTPEEARAGRLGGTLEEIQTRFGEPDWTDVGLVGFNAADLNGVETILVAYHDDDGTVYRISMVYLEAPVEFDDPVVRAEVVAAVLPTDKSCTTKARESGLGPEMYRCKAESVKGLYTAEELKAFGVKGSDGYFSYSVNPTDNEYYEVIAQFGTDSDIPVPTPQPTEPPAPTAAPTLEDQYPPVADVRELAIGRGFSKFDKLSVSGSVFTISVDSEGAFMQIWVGAPDGSREAVIVGYAGDTTGVFEGTWITAYGVYNGTFCGTNAYGGEICQPVILADVVNY